MDADTLARRQGRKHPDAGEVASPAFRRPTRAL